MWPEIGIDGICKFAKTLPSKLVKELKLFNKAEMLALSALIFVYVWLFSYFSYTRYEDFYTTNWDFGIIRQLLWTTSHGYLMFETGDFETSGILSFLQVHSGYILSVISPIFSAYPHAFLLFLIQTLAVSLSAIPLYLISREKIGDRVSSFFVVLIFLFNFGIISAMFYDLHLESGIPVEFFSLYYLLSRRKYGLSFIVLLLGSMTLEVFPFLAMATALYFAYDRYSAEFTKPFKIFSNPDFRRLLMFFLSSMSAFLVLLIVRLEVLPTILHSHTNSTIVVSQSVLSLFAISTNSGAILSAIFYWLVLYAALGYLSFLSPKHLIIAFPWLFATIFLYGNIFPAYHIFGFQYTFIAIPPLFVGLVNGLKFIADKTKGLDRIGLLLPFILVLVIQTTIISIFNLPLVILDANQPNLDIVLFAIVPILLIMVWLFGRFLVKCRSNTQLSLPRLTSKARVTLFSFIIVLNLILGPLNTANFGASVGAGYNFHYSLNPERQYIQAVVKLIPGNSGVLSSDNLFPYVADNPNAYAMLWFPANYSKMTPYLPFSSLNLPNYVLVDAAQIGFMPSFLNSTIENESIYGLKADIIYNGGYPGSIYLFEKGYSGNAINFYISKYGKTTFVAPNSLSLGPSGELVKSPFSKFGTAVKSYNASNPGQGNGPVIWYGPYYSLPQGNYTIILNLTGGSYNRTGIIPIMTVDGINDFTGTSYYTATLYSNSFSSGGWTNVVFNIKVPVISINEFRGFLIYKGNVPNGYVVLNYIELVRTS